MLRCLQVDYSQTDDNRGFVLLAADIAQGLYTLRAKLYEAGKALTIGNVGDLTKDVVSADLFITLWWADQRLADHSNIDFGTNAPVCGLEVKTKM